MNTQTANKTMNKLNANINVYLPRLVELIQSHFGIVIHEHQYRELYKTISNACIQFNLDLESYLRELEKGTEGSPLVEHLITGITVGETYFFRDKKQMELLKNYILPHLIKIKRKENNLSLRVWSAGCSSGEEIYTVAIMLHELLPDINVWNLSLMGTDINALILRKAIDGQYGEWSMRSITEYYKQNYFYKKNDKYNIIPLIKQMAHFEYLNLNDDTYPSIINGTNAQDIILCRNVLIYFDNQAVNSIMMKLSASLVEDGFLLLGASDPVNIKDTNLTFHHTQGLMFTRSMKKIPDEVRKNEIIHQKVKINIPHISAKKMAPIIHAEKASDNRELIDRLMNESRWQDVLDELSRPNSKQNNTPFRDYVKATALANLGRLDESIQFCQESLMRDSTNIHVRFILAMSLLEFGKAKEAETELRKTLFLDHQFVVGHFQLGLLLIHNNQLNTGLKCLKNALSIVKAKDPNIELEGINCCRFREILEHEIDLHTVKGNEL
ncbi:MAG: CheR family methyltransferase [Gammaproteobacteria bacterium]|nr:CheR family methyltransferase [Gammaproteobacteria bacterium]